MAVDKSIDYVVQDGYENYTKNSDSVTVPREFKSRKDATPTSLAYITKDEAKMLKKMKKGTPHKGPSGVPSYDDYDARTGSYRSGAAMSAAETGGKTDRDRRDMAAAGISPQEAKELRAAAINAGAGQRVNPGFFDSKTNLTRDEMRMARDQRRNDPFASGAYRNTRGGIVNFIKGGGLLGALLSGIGSLFGLGKRPGEATYDMSEFNDLGLLTDRVNPTFQNDLGNELMLSTQKTPERFLPNAGPKQVNIPTESYGLQSYNAANNEIPFQPYYDFNTYGTATAAIPQGTDALAPTPVENVIQDVYSGVKNIGAKGNSFLDSLYNAELINQLGYEAFRKFPSDSATGPLSDARHMAASNELSKSLTPFDNRIGEFIGDTLAYGAGLINEVPALARGFNKENFDAIKEDLAANYAGTFGTPNTTTAQQIYDQVFADALPTFVASQAAPYGTAAAAEVRPTIGIENTPIGPIPTGDVGLNASGRLGNLTATIDAIDALKGESVDPKLNFSGTFDNTLLGGQTNVFGNFSDDVQNLGLNFNNDRGLSGGIIYDAITGEPRFDIGFRRTFADGGLASLANRRG